MGPEVGTRAACRQECFKELGIPGQGGRLMTDKDKLGPGLWRVTHQQPLPEGGTAESEHQLGQRKEKMPLHHGGQLEVLEVGA